MSITILLAMAAGAAAVDPQHADLTIRIDNVRNAKGVIHACLTRDPRHFPDCRGDPQAVLATIPATGRTMRFPTLAAGRYAVTLFHDENRNQRLDMMLGIPREGFGFSRNPKIRFGAPKFHQVTVDIAPGEAGQAIRLQYLL